MNSRGGQGGIKICQFLTTTLLFIQGMKSSRLTLKRIFFHPPLLRICVCRVRPFHAWICLKFFALPSYFPVPLQFFRFHFYLSINIRELHLYFNLTIVSGCPWGTLDRGRVGRRARTYSPGSWRPGSTAPPTWPPAAARGSTAGTAAALTSELGNSIATTWKQRKR